MLLEHAASPLLRGHLYACINRHPDTYLQRTTSNSSNTSLHSYTDTDIVRSSSEGKNHGGFTCFCTACSGGTGPGLLFSSSCYGEWPEPSPGLLRCWSDEPWYINPSDFTCWISFTQIACVALHLHAIDGHGTLAERVSIPKSTENSYSKSMILNVDCFATKKGKKYCTSRLLHLIII